MISTGPRRPGRSQPTRPFQSLLLSFCLLSLVPPASAGAQATMLWPELSRLLAPESGIGGGGWGTPQPVAGWANPGSGTMGIMGYSPAVDPQGWMDAGFTGIRFERWGTLIYRARRGGRRSDDFSSDYAAVNAATPLIGEDLYLMLGGTETAGVARAQFSDRGYLRRSSSGMHSWLGIRADGDRWDCMLSWGHLGYFRGAGEAAGAFRLAFGGGAAVSAWASKRVAGNGMTAVYDRDDAEVDAAYGETALGIGLAGSIKRWRVRLRAVQRAGSGRGADLPVHRIRPRPGMILAELRVESPGGGWRAAAGAGWGEHRVDLESRGLRYGRFLIHDDRFWVRASFDTEWRAWAVQLWSGLTRTELDGEGDLEFWPFTPTLIDLLGLRRRAVTDASVNVASAGTRGTLISSEFALVLGLDLHHIWTDGWIESWEPLVLGMGRTNVLIDRLNVRSAQLLDLGVQVKIPSAGSVEIQGGAAQLVPMAVQKRSFPGIIPPPEPAERGAVAEWGGLRWWIAVMFDMIIVGGDV